jgi:hypothetical protein
MQIENVEVFLENTIASACNRMFRKKSSSRRIGLIPVGGYTDNRKQSRKAIAWLIQKREGKRRLHGKKARNGSYPNLQIYLWTACARRARVYEFNGCYWHGHTCQPF